MTLRYLGAVAGIVVAAILLAVLFPRPKDEGADSHAAPSSQPKRPQKPQIAESAVGRGKPARPGDTLTVEYELHLQNGKKVASSRDDKRPLRFLLGSGTMMPGWDAGLDGARVGSVRKIVVPPALGYGEQGSPDGKIPGNSTLTFDVKVLKIERIEDEPLLDPLLNTGRKPGAPQAGDG